MTSYYNENDPYVAAWLRNLIAARHIAPGIVDERSIEDIEAFELMEFTQCHFFAGIGVWSHALRQAGWSDDRPIWTGSCPCQPFSAAGKKKGFEDDRHLWPYWFDLIKQCKPAIVVGEQVDKALEWIDLVSSDLEKENYAFGAGIISAAGFGGAHIRHRNYFVAISDGTCTDGLAHHHRPRSQGHRQSRQFNATERRENASRYGAEIGAPDRLGNSCLESVEWRAGSVSGEETQVDCERQSDGRHDHGYSNASEADRLGNSENSGRQSFSDVAGSIAKGMEPSERQSIQPSVAISDSGLADSNINGRNQRRQCVSSTGNDGTVRDGIIYEIKPTDALMLGRTPVDWLYGRDGKFRPVEPGTFPLVNAAPSRVGRLRAFGNALDAETATQFCETVREICDGV